MYKQKLVSWDRLKSYFWTKKYVQTGTSFLGPLKSYFWIKKYVQAKTSFLGPLKSYFWMRKSKIVLMTSFTLLLPAFSYVLKVNNKTLEQGVKYVKS